jgi:TetR/AcrR family tetracycline transcriptional repressor
VRVASNHAAAVTPDDVVDAAFALLRDHGWDGVSVRPLAATVGISPMTLYARVGTKVQLFDAMAARLTRTLVFETHSSDDWRVAVKAWAMSLRRQLLVHPDAVRLFDDRPWAVARTLAPLVDCLRAGGYEGEDNVRVCRLLSWAVFGFIHVEANRLATLRDGDPAGVLTPVSRPLALDVTAERLAGHIPLATEEEIDSMFEYQLDVLIKNIAADLDRV